MSKYIGRFIALFFVSAILLGIYKQITTPKISAKATRIVCQTKTTTFEKVYIQDKVSQVQKLLVSGKFIISSKVWKSKYAKSKLFSYISSKEIDLLTLDTIKLMTKSNHIKDNRLVIKFYTRENDIKDPGKKTNKSKLYAGYLVYEFILDKQIVYKIQTDFMNKNGEDIPNRIMCVFKSLLTLKG